MSATPTVRPTSLLANTREAHGSRRGGARMANTLAAARLICASTDGCPFRPVTRTSHPSPVGEDPLATAMNEPAVLTVAQAAEWLETSKNTVYERVKRGELPSFRIGRGIRIFKHELVAFSLRLQTGQNGE